MKLYIDPRIREINSIKTLEVFFEGYKNSNIEILPLEEKFGYQKIEDINKVNSWKDFVRDFVEYYMSTLSDSLNIKDGVQHKDIANQKAVTDYITCRLYAAKGYPEIFEVMKELLKIGGLEFSIEAEFNGIFLTNIHSLKFNTLDLDTIITYLLNALFYLILIGEVAILIDQLTMDILLEGHKVVVSSIIGYNEVPLTIENQ